MKKLLRSRLISFSRESRAGAGVCKFVIMDVGQADPRLGQRVDARIDHRRRPAHIALRAGAEPFKRLRVIVRSEEHTSELESLMRISYAVFCLKKKNQTEQEYSIL